MGTIKFGMKYWKKYLWIAILAQISSFLAITADLMIPLLSEILIDYIILDTEPDSKGIFAFLISGKYGEPRTFELFFHIAAVFGLLILARIILIYFKNVTFQRLGLDMETDLRVDTFGKLMELDSETIAEYNTGELLQTVNSDTIMFKDFFCRMIPNMADSIFVLIICTYILTTINYRLLAVPVILIPFFAIALTKFKKIARVNYRTIRNCNSTMNLTVQENIEAVRLVRSFTNEKLEKEKFDQSNDNLKNAHIRQIRLSAKFEVIFSSIKQFAYIGTIAISAILVIKKYMKVGFLATCSSYVLKIMDHISQINNTIFQMQQQLVAGGKIQNFMACESRIVEKENAVDVSEKPHIQFQDMSLVMEEQQVLKHINLDIPYGKKVGITGGTGSGKSMLLKCLVRIHDVSGGEIKIDDRDIREYRLKSLRDKFSYVFQEVFLFSNSVETNIAFSAPEIDDFYIEKAAKNAQAHDFIMELSEKYQTIVGERGLGLSGGQKQRVSIARALLKDAPVLVMDDSTSALDMGTEKKLLKTIKEDYPDKTVLISAHRLSSVVDCDEIIYMQDGEIVERGTFEELMKLGGHFARVYEIQENQRKSAIDYDNLDNGEEVV
ncbi:MAG: ABC transporter ATP-binding protein [Lachnospiraceae bacterium]|nr:ABC transporter ATP-binding protein [Lachnospiraceae bacterium]